MQNMQRTTTRLRKSKLKYSVWLLNERTLRTDEITSEVYIYAMENDNESPHFHLSLEPICHTLFLRGLL